MKTLAGGLVVFLLAVGFVACGGGDDSGSTATEASSPSTESQSAAQGEADDPSQKKPGAKSESQAKPESSEASDFVPKQHSDSGGGVEQFRTKGGDNSVQEFGEEADSAEFEAAAAALHNFLDARAEGNWAAACEYLSKTVVLTFEKLSQQSKGAGGSGCAGILKALTNPAAKATMKAEADRADVGSLRTEDGQAFIIYKGLEGTVMAIGMVDEDGEWKVGSLAGAPL